MNAHHDCKWLLSTSLILVLSGCVGGSTPPSRFYLLEPVAVVAPAETAGNASALPIIVMDPVRIPRYVDRAQIVTATAKNAYQLNELNRWAEALDQNLTRVLSQNLASLVPAQVLSGKAGNRTQPESLRLTLTILEFHVNPQGLAGLTAQWQIKRGDALLLSRQESYHEPAANDDYPLIVAALNECVTRLSRDLAAAIRTLP